MLPQGRNKAVEKAYEFCPEFTHLVFIDDDMCNFGPDHIVALVNADKDMISALVVCRHPRYEIVADFVDGNDANTVLEFIKKQEVREKGMLAQHLQR